MIPHFKIRASACGSIMGLVNRPTPKQLAYLNELQAKAKRTAKQEETLEELIAKRDAKPSLSAGAKTYCEQWLKEQIGFYNRRAEFSNKYTERGIQCEPAAIELLADAMGYGMISKNEQHFEDDDITGTPDVLVPHTVDDVKSSWDWRTFPLFSDELPESDYYYQGQCYMALTGRPKASVNYCLIDTPEEFIEREAFYVSKRAGFNEVEMELYDEVRAKMTYDGLPLSLRFKRYEFERDETTITAIRQQVKLCRDYIKNLYCQIHKIPPFMIASHTNGVTIIEAAN